MLFGLATLTLLALAALVLFLLAALILLILVMPLHSETLLIEDKLLKSFRVKAHAATEGEDKTAEGESHHVAIMLELVLAVRHGEHPTIEPFDILDLLSDIVLQVRPFLSPSQDEEHLPCGWRLLRQYHTPFWRRHRSPLDG